MLCIHYSSQLFVSQVIVSPMDDTVRDIPCGVRNFRSTHNCNKFGVQSRSSDERGLLGDTLSQPRCIDRAGLSETFEAQARSDWNLSIKLLYTIEAVHHAGGPSLWKYGLLDTFYTLHMSLKSDVIGTSPIFWWAMVVVRGYLTSSELSYYY